MSTPTQRISRLLDEGASFVAYLPGNIIIDVTPDVTTAMDESSSNTKQLGMIRNLLDARDLGGDVPTLVEFT